MKAVQQPWMSEEEYFQFEASAEERHEWYRGEIFAMAGGSADHNRITFDTARALSDVLGGHPCEVFLSDVCLHIRAHGLYTYPDVMVICGGVHFLTARTDTVTNPTLIAEVLSDSTRDYDLGQKWEFYRALESLQSYLLIDQARPHVTHYERTAEGWLLRDHEDEGATIALPSLDIAIPLAALYRRIRWDDPAPDAAP